MLFLRIWNGRTGMGSMDAILFCKLEFQKVHGTADYLTDFIARRNAHLGAFALQSIYE